ncbi:unnamed protein product [Mycena citricolor]|uniref:Class E vacuolar protein-sorting machinery protein HSE1 n=1 Tax=Mycena citricolor TaxID=2018698 RepID=A0AAD2K239_9AGAR|nr:unnamed protein product [Mycena citricolor]
MASTESPQPESASSPSSNGIFHKHQDSDAQEMLIASLRGQIQDLFSQVTQLNGKLVKSYDRVSDLEDDAHMSASQARQTSLKIAQLELERTQHLSALNTGLLVEKAQVTAELTRLMEKATEEAVRRGRAETAKADIEKDLDDLSATLFAQANTMVAEARYAQALADRRVEASETALKGAEEMVGMMQIQMQRLQDEKDNAEHGSRRNWEIQDRPPSSVKLMSSHLPYQEFLLFVAHLRSIHPSSLANPPAMTTLLPMAFLSRLSNEDSEPTMRLDLAPSLNWLSRRSVLSAIHAGQLTIEPMATGAMLAESNSAGAPTIPGVNSSNNNISCALCGTPIFSNPELPPHYAKPPTHPSLHGNSGWSTSVIKKTLSYTGTSSVSRPSSEHGAPYPPQIYIFRIATPLPPPQPMNPPTRTASPSPFLPSVSSRATPPPAAAAVAASSLSNLSFNSLTQSAAPSTTIYPLCTSGWCLARLRTTCTLWSFVRTGIVERVWEEEVPNIPQTALEPNAAAAPPIPPRRKGLWGMATKLGSWSGEKKVEEKPLPPTAVVPTSAPPLPKRNEERRRSSLPVSSAPPLPARRVVEQPPAERVEVVEETVAEQAPVEQAPVEKASVEEVSVEQAPVEQAPMEQTAAEEPANPTVPPATEPAAEAAAAEQTEEPPAPVASLKRMSAHQIALPDSRPSTPMAETPAAETAVVESSGPAAQPAAPPPLPRRAAARRPVPAPPTTESAPPAEPADAPPKVAAVEVQSDIVAAEPVEAKPTTEEPPASQPVLNGDLARSESPLPEKEKEDDEEDDEVYVGDATWEERTWKELSDLSLFNRETSDCLFPGPSAGRKALPVDARFDIRLAILIRGITESRYEPVEDSAQDPEHDLNPIYIGFKHLCGKCRPLIINQNASTSRMIMTHLETDMGEHSASCLPGPVSLTNTIPTVQIAVPKYLRNLRLQQLARRADSDPGHGRQHGDRELQALDASLDEGLRMLFASLRELDSEVTVDLRGSPVKEARGREGDGDENREDIKSPDIPSAVLPSKVPEMVDRVRVTARYITSQLQERGRKTAGKEKAKDAKSPVVPPTPIQITKQASVASTSSMASTASSSRTVTELTRKIGRLTATCSDDWLAMQEVCGLASSSDESAREAVRALRYEFRFGAPSAQLVAAQLWALLLKSASGALLYACTSHKFLDSLEDLLVAPQTDPVVRSRVLRVLGAAAYASGTKLAAFRLLWQRVRPPEAPEEGVPFADEDPIFNPRPLPTDAAHNVITSEKPLTPSRRRPSKTRAAGHPSNSMSSPDAGPPTTSRLFTSVLDTESLLRPLRSKKPSRQAPTKDAGDLPIQSPPPEEEEADFFRFEHANPVAPLDRSRAGSSFGLSSLPSLPIALTGFPSLSIGSNIETGFNRLVPSRRSKGVLRTAVATPTVAQSAVAAAAAAQEAPPPPPPLRVDSPVSVIEPLPPLQSEQTRKDPAVRARAQFNYFPVRADGDQDDADEIAFTKGEELEILDREGRWWMARKHDGTTGIVRADYFTIVAG